MTSATRDRADDGTEGATARLASFAVSSPGDKIPAEVRSRLRDLLLDHIGVTAYGGHGTDSAPFIRAAIQRLNGRDGSATVIGESRGYREQYAALLNGCFAHSLDFDDSNEVQVGHPGAAVIPAAFAEAERVDSSGRAFTDALAVGYEVACRVGGGLGMGSYERGFHSTAVSGIFGAAAAIARLRGFTPEATNNAFGLALSKAAGSMQYLANGSWNKRLHPGFAAHDAWLCAALAEEGTIGAADALTGRYGLLNGYTAESHPEVLVENLGTEWALLRSSVKPYPSCRFTHGAVDAALDLRDQVSDIDRPLVHMRVGLSATAMSLVGERSPNKVAPRNSVDAQFSVYFQVAAAWLDGDVTPESYRRVGDADINSLAERIVTAEQTLPAPHAAALTVRIGDRELSRTVDRPLGEPDTWPGDEALRNKFLSLTSGVYGEKHAVEIADRVAQVDLDGSMRDFAAALRISPVTL